MTILSLGGGVQSTTIALMACEGELALDAIVFADTGGEPKAVYRHIDWLLTHCTTHGIECYVVQQGNLLEDALSQPSNPERRWASIPAYTRDAAGKVGMLRRQCTSEYKIKPIQRLLKNWLGASPTSPATLYLGISLDESVRMRESAVRYIRHAYPLIDRGMRRGDCVRWLEARGYPIPPKSSCLFCPFHSDAYWRELKEQSPDEFALACKVDESIRHLPRLRDACYLHRSAKPLAEVRFGEQQAFDFECTGHCHT